MAILYKAMSSRGPAETSKAVLAVHRGAILMAPSRRITSPLSIGLPTILSTSCAYSDGLPRQAGCGTCAPKARTEERRGGKEGVSKCRYRWVADDEKKKKKNKQKE